MSEVTVMMPLQLTREMMQAVRRDPFCSVDDELWHTRLGWLICAWDVLVQHRREPFSKPPNLEPVIAWLENGCDPKEAAKELRIYQDVMHPKTPNAKVSGAGTASAGLTG
jgi:hypothetical protein